MPIHSVDIDRKEAIRNWLATHKLKLNGFAAGLAVGGVILALNTPIFGMTLLAMGGIMFFAGRHIGDK